MSRLVYSEDMDRDEGAYIDEEEYFGEDEELHDPESVYRSLGIDLSDWLRDHAD